MTTPTLEEVAKLVEFCRQHGIRRCKAGDIELEFSPDSEPLDVKRAKELTDQFMADQPSDTDMLFWSAWAPVKPGGEVPDGEA